jgi:hypothetical protein
MGSNLIRAMDICVRVQKHNIVSALIFGQYSVKFSQLMTTIHQKKEVELTSWTSYRSEPLSSVFSGQWTMDYVRHDLCIMSQNFRESLKQLLLRNASKIIRALKDTYVYMIVWDVGGDCIVGTESPQDDASNAIVVSGTLAANSDIALSIRTEWLALLPVRHNEAISRACTAALKQKTNVMSNEGPNWSILVFLKLQRHNLRFCKEQGGLRAWIAQSV